ncbi:hypothetical protein MNBD_CHLOROFLEXI01-567 [hydrothermal vent metagenome]|uniref:Uncharacterized protein n=1 Tax=hydrothermal vent metagenome TaxID=652676 RepID=A0A3B0UKF0_9ZZZZ
MDESPSTKEAGLDPFFKRIDLSNKPISLHCEQCMLPLGKEMANCPQRPSGHCPYLFTQKRSYSLIFTLLYLGGAFVLWVESTQR